MACVATLGCDGVALPNPASIVGLALHASRAFGQPQLTRVCSLAVSNVRPGRAVPPTSMLCTSGGLSVGGMRGFVWFRSGWHFCLLPKVYINVSATFTYHKQTRQALFQQVKGFCIIISLLHGLSDSKWSLSVPSLQYHL